MATQPETQVLPSTWDGKNEILTSNLVQKSPIIVRRNVDTEFAYYQQPEDSGPAPAVDVSNYKKQNKNWQPATVYDVRESSVNHTLDTTGIQYVSHKSAVKDFFNDANVKDVYYTETTDLLSKITGASKVYILHHLVRHAHTHPLQLKGADAAIDEENADSNFSEAIKGPLRGVHVDQSYDEAPRMVKKLYPDEAEQLLKGRFQLINIWRPIKTIYKDPFAVIDATTVLEDELVPLLVVRPERNNETFTVRAPLEGRKDGGHKWYYMSHQTAEDVLLFKIFDSETDGRARRVPHSSFEDKEYENMEPRASIEVRALIFYEDDVE